MDYFLKASALIILFYVCYKLFLQRETYFQSNRWFLLIGLLISTVLPLVVIPIYIEYTPIPMLFSETTAFTPQPITESPSFNYWLLLPLLYVVGTLIIFGKVILQFLSLNKLFKTQKKSKQNNYVFIETEADIAPFSFFNRIVFNVNQFSQEELNHIITHEKVHAKQFHSIDVIVMQIATILFWFNPIIWWYKKALLQNLEFIADSEAQNKIECSKSYQTLLLKASLNQNQLALPTNFYQSLIKKRIIMLQKSKSKNSSYFKLLIVLPFLGLFLMSVNTEEIYVAKLETATIKAKTETFTITSTSSDKEIETIKNRLEAQTDGLKIRFSDIKRNSKGEIINLVIKTKLKGKSRFNHNVTYQSKLGKPIQNIVLKIENDELVFGNEKQDMVMRVTKNGVITETLKTKKETLSAGTIHLQNNGDSIKMNLNSDDKTDNNFTYIIITEDTGGEKSKLLINKKGDKPLYVVNGKIIDESEVNFDTENIASIKTLKGKSATNLFGNLAKNGALLITTKSDIEADKKLYILDGKQISRIDLEKAYSNTMSILKVLNEKDGKAKYGEKGENGVVIVKSNTTNSNTSNKNSIIKTNGDIIYFYKTELKMIDSIKPKKTVIQFPQGDTNSSQTIYRQNTFTQDSVVVFLNGKKIENSKLKQLDPNQIKSVNVKKEKSKINSVGKRKKNKIIEVTTKDSSAWRVKYEANKIEYNSEENPTKKDSLWSVKYDANITFPNDQSFITKSASYFTIPKTATDKSIEANRKFMKERYGIDTRISQLRRNKAGEIIKIKIALKDGKGQKSSAIFQNKDGIPTIKYGNNLEGDLIISSK